MLSLTAAACYPPNGYHLDSYSGCAMRCPLKFPELRSASSVFVPQCNLFRTDTPLSYSKQGCIQGEGYLLSVAPPPLAKKTTGLKYLDYVTSTMC